MESSDKPDRVPVTRLTRFLLWWQSDRGRVARAGTGGLAALEGRAVDAVRLYSDALEGFREVGFSFQEALTAIEMATVLDPSIPEVAVSIETARTILTRLGARPYLDQLEGAIQGHATLTEPARARTRDTSAV